MKKISLKKLIVAAMFAAITCVATMVIHIPIPATNGYINVGDAIVILSALLLGGVPGCLAAGIGSALADVFLSYMTYAPGTFVIKTLMAVAAYFLCKALTGKMPLFVARLLSAICAELVMVGGYFLYESVFLSYGLGAVPSIFSNLIQGAGGVVVSMILITILDANHFLTNKLKNL